MSSSFPLVLDEWSDTDSMVSLHSFASSWTSTRATLKSISSASSLSSYEEEQPINDMMFEDHRLPLFASDFDRPIACVVNEAIIDLQSGGFVPHYVYYKNFVLDYNDYVLDYGDFQHSTGSRLSDYLHCLDHRGTFTLTYHPNFEIQLVLVCAERRRIKAEFCGRQSVSDVKYFLDYEKGMTFEEIRLFHKGMELEDDNEYLEDIFGLNSENPDPYALYELEVCVRGRGGGKTSTAKNGKSLVKQVMEKKKTKGEEYKDACVNLNKEAINIPDASEDIKDAKAWLKHFASVPESQSTTLVSGAIGELDKERLEKCIPVLKVGSKTCNGGDAKLEYIVKVMMSGLLEKLDAHEQNIHRLKSALVLELVKHCVNVSLQSGKIDVKNIREQMQSRLVKLTTSSPPEASDVAMESLTDLFGRTRMSA